MFSVSLNILISTLDKSVKSSENKLGLNQRVGVQQVGTKFFSESSKILLTSRLFPVQSLNTEHRTQNTEHRTQNTEHRTQNTEHRTQNSELRTQNSELRVHRRNLSGTRKPARNFSTGEISCWLFAFKPIHHQLTQRVLGINKVKGGF